MQERPLVRADLVTGMVLAAFGAAIVAESLAMPRLEERAINPWTAPGLVPGLLGLVIVALGLMLALRSAFGGAVGPPADSDGDVPAEEARSARIRLALCLGLCLAYAAGLVGRMPFWLATGLFVSAFVIAFEWRHGDDRRVRVRKLVAAAVLAVAAALSVPFLFETLFLVRLP